MRADARAKKALLLAIGSSIAVSAMAVFGVMIDNPGEVAAADTTRAAATLTALSIAAPAALFAAGGILRAAAYAFPVFLFVFFKFVGLYSVVMAADIGYAQSVFAATAALLILSAAAVDPFRRRDPAALGGLLFVITASAAAASAASYALETARESGKAQAALAALAPHVPSPGPTVAAFGLPDIIYIVPDRYAGAPVLADEYGGNAEPFESALKSRGFFVADNARSNYPKTFLSLASTFNMTKLEPLIAAMGPSSHDKKPVFALVRDNAVQSRLRAMGYSYAHLGSWWEATRESPHADHQYYGLRNLWSQLNEFEHALLRTTPAAWFATYGGFVDRQECARLKHQLDWLQTARTRSEGPIFVFAHLTLPHDPITMDGEGDCVPHIYYSAGAVSWDEYRAAYRDYVGYLNRRLLEIFDANKAADDGRGLIFVVQADEGPYPKRLQENGAMELFDFDDREIRTKFGIINAMYWDADRYGPPYLTKTPVNNWRIIFSKLTGQDMPLLREERSILFRSDKLPYDVKDVTAAFEPAPSPVAALD